MGMNHAGQTDGVEERSRFNVAAASEGLGGVALPLLELAGRCEMAFTMQGHCTVVRRQLKERYSGSTRQHGLKGAPLRYEVH